MNTLIQSASSEALCEIPFNRQDVLQSDPPVVNRAPRQRSLRVLCVDDDEMVLEGMKNILVYFGHRVGMAPGGKQAIEMFRASILESEPYDVVITDMSMPEVGGQAVAENIKAEAPGTPVILISGAGNTILDDSSSCSCIDVVLQKPVPMHDFNDAVLRTVKAI